ncbi:4-alpha-glucanotransferase [Crenothrix polyspora]|uniref:4-alpha-glucanotransferase n=1 Tax=Crenothrix polyspora TaxID=360316 RepID=A0A1R4H3P4_9GAMM|nr:4-alpha-glucanotransferase [Crenothrix polyspora]SJM90469.1 4-alpha-glucanotransferase [Crenothrix polyspora]
MNGILNTRRAGVLLHITSLPGASNQGDLGPEAYNFVNFLHDTGVSVWQTLPLGVTHFDGSPYQCLSAHAGNPSLINLDWLVKQGWLPEREGTDNNGYTAISGEDRNSLLTDAYDQFLESASVQNKTTFALFCKDKAFWLDDFALFTVLRREFNQQCWNQWPAPLKERQAKALVTARQQFKMQIEAIKFQQYVFFTQWLELKAYADQKGVHLFGDIPIFVSYDSADVWANRKVFKLDDTGEMLVVAGVPPDYFSETGQRWGNPHYNWDYLLDSGFAWWLDRMQTQLEQFDVLRIDHFRGLEAAWEIPAHEPTAIHGTWVQAPGKQLLEAIIAKFGQVALVAEDLGIITPEVEALRDEFHLPGMKILQFAFGGGSDNPYLPHRHEKNSVVYTGTHDNDTTVGWVDKLSDDERRYIYDYLDNPQTSLHCALIHAALGSVANLAIIPMQDILELGTEHRMNTPGTTEGNWHWRFQWEQLTPDRVARLAHLIDLFNRRA